MLYVFSELALSPDEACGIIIGDACSEVYNPFEYWNITMPDVPKPSVNPIPKPKVCFKKNYIFTSLTLSASVLFTMLIISLQVVIPLTIIVIK